VGKTQFTPGPDLTAEMAASATPGGDSMVNVVIGVCPWSVIVSTAVVVDPSLTIVYEG
jgi:hypothetical protein